MEQHRVPTIFEVAEQAARQKPETGQRKLKPARKGSSKTSRRPPARKTSTRKAQKPAQRR